MFHYRVFLSLIAIFTIFLSWQAFADMEHHKNGLIGGRAAVMGGAYSAIADDASGSYYNPAGLVHAGGDSISGSANTYSTSKATYTRGIDDRDWVRESRNLLPNFFGLVKKSKGYSFGVSYLVRDSFIEHQDQIFSDLTGLDDPIDNYILNIHSEDNTYNFGPSIAKKINDKLSVGLTTYFHYRLFRRSQSQLLEFTDSTDQTAYQNILKKERGVYTKLGIMWSPVEKISTAFTIAKTTILTSLTDNQNTTEARSISNNGFLGTSSNAKRKMPWEISTGVAYFMSPYNVFSADFDLFLTSDPDKKTSWNISFGGEHFFNESHAVRAGFFTNRTNNKDITTEATPRRENINFYGISTGYALYTKATSLTFGTIYSRGSGKAQIYDDRVAATKLKKYALSFIVSADYGF
jgi:long-subunit fatty acid transport protein